MIQDFVFLCRKISSTNGYFGRYIIKNNTSYNGKHVFSKTQISVSLKKFHCISGVRIYNLSPNTKKIFSYSVHLSDQSIP